MSTINSQNKNNGFGTAPVFFTALSTILGAILFLRFGFAVSTLGFWGTIAIILLGHLITIPTALAVSEIATNTRVEGGGVYFIISRSFGLKIGATVGITLYISQAISIAFYVIAFTEAFYPFFNWWHNFFGFELPRQAISVPTLIFLALLIVHKGAGLGMKMLYIVNLLLFISLFFFFIGKPVDTGEGAVAVTENFTFINQDKLFMVLAICFPAFTGMTAGIGLSGDLKKPSRSIPLGTILGTVTGLVLYILVVWKLAVSAPADELMNDQLIMSRIAVFGSIVIPVGLAACTFSSALGSILVAPRTMQAIASDRNFPFHRVNNFLSKGRGETQEPVNATILSFFVALIFVMVGSIDVVAEIISMFFLISYGTLCLISFLYHFGSSPSYRPRFKSKWYFSLGGFVMSVWVMFKINSFYTIFAYIVLVIIYLFLEHYNKTEKGFVDIFRGSLFQLNRILRVFMQKKQGEHDPDEWRPAAICVSPNSFERDKILELMKWISHQHGFGTYFHYIQGYYSRHTFQQSREVLKQLIIKQKGAESTLYIDTMISPSYTSAIAQVIQAPSISGMDNNMVIFEYDKDRPEELPRILENINLVRAGNFDVCIFAGSTYPIRNKNNIHVWIRSTDEKNTNLMILLGYIIIAHSDWKRSQLKLFITSTEDKSDALRQDIAERVAAGRLPITMNNIEIVVLKENQSLRDVVNTFSKYAGLTIIGFREEIIRHEDGLKFFTNFDGVGDVLFVNATQSKTIN